MNSNRATDTQEEDALRRIHPSTDASAASLSQSQTAAASKKKNSTHKYMTHPYYRSKPSNNIFPVTYR